MLMILNIHIPASIQSSQKNLSSSSTLQLEYVNTKHYYEICNKGTIKLLQKVFINCLSWIENIKKDSVGLYYCYFILAFGSKHNTNIKSYISLNLTTILSDDVSDLRRCALVHSLSPDNSSIFVQPRAAQPTSGGNELCINHFSPSLVQTGPRHPHPAPDIRTTNSIV